ncbi:hypothetical protein VNO77_44119 [Canavalia gladiata]|uniref:DUF4378 domain-containing protein n=1 Tax=Canavalia gladiata TaxID=3824 RepID=A0AAN9JXN9_CANGL
MNLRRGIFKIHEQCLNAQPWVGPTISNIIGPKLIKNRLGEGLYRMVRSQGKVKDNALGKVLVRKSQWLNLRDDIDVIDRKVERMLLDDLVAEIVISNVPRTLSIEDNRGPINVFDDEGQNHHLSRVDQFSDEEDHDENENDSD